MDGSIEFTLDMSLEEPPKQPDPVSEGTPVLKQNERTAEESAVPPAEEPTKTDASDTADPENAFSLEEIVSEVKNEATEPEKEVVDDADASDGPVSEKPAAEPPEMDVTKEELPSRESELKIQESLDSLMQEQKAITTFAQKIADDVRGMHKLYHNEYVGRLRDMQDELDRYHEIEREKVFDDILKEIAQIYCNNETLLTMSSDEKVSKSIRNFFNELAQMLDDHGVHLQKSSVGDKRSRFCQVIDRIPTEDESLHDTIAVSRASGFANDKKAIIKEVVDIYVYKKPAESAESAPQA